MTASDLDKPADEARWRAVVEAALKGAPIDRLTAKTAEGLAIPPLYRETNFPAALDPSGAPGSAPFVRGVDATRDPAAPWAIRQIFDQPDPDRANRDIIADLAGGVSSIELVIDPAGEAGIAIRDRADLDHVLANVIPEAAPIALDAGAYGVWAAKLLAAKLKGASAAKAAFNVDPIGALMNTGAMGAEDIAAAVLFARDLADTFPHATALRVDARPVHEAGGGEAQEIAAALASGVAYVDALQKAGVDINAASKLILFSLSVGPDMMLECAKLRALRLTWSRVMEAFGATAPNRAARIHAVTSRRMMTRYDSWTNILRTTSAAFAGAVGGAEAVTVRPLTDAFGLATPFARRIARNTQLVLMEESRLGHVIDPAGGAWSVETMTRDLASMAWRDFQRIEHDGGIVQSLKSGAFQVTVHELLERRRKAFATRKENITGLTDFPLLEERKPEFEIQNYKSAKPSAAPKPGQDIIAGKLAPIRWAEPFETLRARAGGAKAFCATLGPLAEFSPRANFARNLFGVGGIELVDAETIHTDLDALAIAFKASGSPVAILCGADTRYAEAGEAAAKALRAAGASWIVLAGKPGELEAALKAAGVDQFVFAGQDALAANQTLHHALGIKA
jgi:methylmalonyl-CoA mutase